jgi:uncharacterized protein (DUF1697 family)
MTNYIGLLRAVNIGSHNQVAMAALRDLLTGLGFAGCRTLLQSGNVVFTGDRTRPADLERALEAAITRELEVSTDFFIRTAKEWQEIVAGNPFPREAARDPGRLVVMLLKGRPTARAVEELEAAITGDEVMRADGRHAYIVYPNGMGTSRLTNALIERKLGTRSTGRNWNTVLKLHALVRQ